MSTSDEVFFKLVKIAKDQLDLYEDELERLMGAGPLSGEDIVLGELDSLAEIEFLLAVEESFGIKIPDENLGEIKSLFGLVGYLAERQGAGSSSGLEED